MSAVDTAHLERALDGEIETPPQVEVQTAKSREHPWRFSRDAWAYLWAYYRPQWRHLTLLSLVALAQALALLPSLYFIRIALDVAMPHRDLELLLLLGGGVLFARLITSLLALVARWVGAGVAKTAVAHARLDLLQRLYGLSRDFHGASEAGRVHTRITQLSERVDQATTAALSEAGPALLVIAAMLVWLVYVNPGLVAMTLPIAPIGWAAAALARRRVRRQVRVFQENYERFGKGVLFVLGHMDLTKTRGFESGELQRQRATIDGLSHASRRMALSFALYSQTQSLVAGLGAVVILVGGGTAIMHGAMTTGGLFAFIAAAAMVNTYVSKVVGLAPDLIAAEEALGRMRELSVAGPLDPYPQRGEAVAFRGGVALRGVSIGFRGRPVLRDVSLEVAPGDNIAVVGANGAGKTTLLNLVLGFLKPEAGEVLAEQTPYEAADLRLLRRQIGVVPQKPTFFAGSIAENISYGWPEADLAAVAAAAERAGVDGFISSLPLGFATQIGDGGVLLSGGEAQRIAIARALVGQPKLLILDEPTSHLDAQAVSLIMGRLTGAPGRMAILTVSHDDEVVRCARTVYRLERGALKRVRGLKTP